MEPKTFKSPNHQVINRFIVIGKDKFFWPREIRMAKKLIKTYSIEFLSELPEPFPTKFASLAWFMTEDGKKYINTRFFEYKKANLQLNIAQSVTLSNDKIGADVLIFKKPKSIKEFLSA